MLSWKLTYIQRRAVAATTSARVSQPAAVNRSTRCARRLCTTAWAVVAIWLAARSWHQGRAILIGRPEPVHVVAMGIRRAGARCELYHWCCQLCATQRTRMSQCSITEAFQQGKVVSRQGSCLQHSERRGYLRRRGVAPPGDQRQLLGPRCDTEKVKISTATVSRGIRHLFTLDRMDRTVL